MWQNNENKGGVLGDTFEMLSFKINEQTFGINIFKVKEIIRLTSYDKISALPNSHELVMGIKNVRDLIVPIIDIRKAIMASCSDSVVEGFLLILEINNQVHGIIVNEVINIEHVAWSDIAPPPHAFLKKGYISSVAKHNKQVIGILDVEKVIGLIQGEDCTEFKKDIVGLGKNILVMNNSH
jgi:chemotaxis signal transduction protein